MTVLFLHKQILQSVLVCLFVISSSCGSNEDKIKYADDHKFGGSSDSVRSDETTDDDRYAADTVTVQTAEELIKQIRSNRLIKLVSNEYNLTSTLLIDSIEDLRIVGTGTSELRIYERNSTVLDLLNSRNIQLDSLVIGHRESSGHTGDAGILRISDSYNINVSNCRLLGAGTSGLYTKDVYDLKFTDSEISECTFLIFELENSRKIEFINSKFHNNHFSVLGGFTYSTKEVTFLNCDFIHNRPEIAGNPAFNFLENWKDLDEPISFTNCTFKNNKGFKWYGDKIKLNNCQMDSADFDGF